MCRLSAYLPADQGIRARNALTRLAHHLRYVSGPNDTRTLDQLRVDALVETLTRAADNLHHDTSSDSDPDTSSGSPGNPGSRSGSSGSGGGGGTSNGSPSGGD